MTSLPLRCTDYTRIAGWMSALVTTATFSFLHDAYDRLPLLVPIRFDDGNPSQFAFKSPALVYLPFGLQIALAVVFLAVVGVLVRRALRPEGAGGASAAASLHVAEATAILALVWITFQAVNAWRLTSLYRRTFDEHMEIFVVALITAITATVVIMARAVLKVQETGDGTTISPLRQPVVDRRERPLATAVLATALVAGLAAPLYILLTVWGGLRLI